MAADPRIVSAQRSIASDISWARTPNRTERTAPAHHASPVSLAFHLAKIRAEGVVREQDIEAAAASAHRAYMRGLSLRAAATRRANKAARERERLERRSA